MTALSIFRITPGTRDHDDILADRDRLRAFPVRVEGSLIGILYARRGPLRNPRWRPFFENLVSFEGYDLRTSAVSAVLIVERPGKRVFALSFGYGRWLIRESAIDAGFGLRVVLNAIDPAGIRSIDHKRLETVSRQTREQLSRASTFEYFGLDVERDLLRAVTGTPKDKTLGNRLSGSDQLAVVGDIPIRSLAKQLDRYDTLSGEETYKANFPWVDNLTEIRDPKLLEALDTRLVERLSKGSLKDIWLAPPTILDFEDVSGFRYRGAASAPVHDDLSLEDYFADQRPRAGVTAQHLKADQVRCVRATDGVDAQEWSVRRCLVAEMSFKGAAYILNDSKWYHIDRAFLASVEAAIAGLKPSSAKLPQYTQRSEGAYNEATAKANPNVFALLDRKTIRVASRGSIEPCDLYSCDRQFIHIKRYSGSSTLSHLFNQGVNSAELFLSDRNFRQDFSGLLREPFRLDRPERAIAPHDYEVAYGVIVGRGQSLRLPFFSKLSLRNASRLLTQFGYQVTLTSIPTR